MKNIRPKGPLPNGTASPPTFKEQEEEEEEDQAAGLDRLGLLGAVLAGANRTPPHWPRQRLLMLGEITSQVRNMTSQVMGHSGCSRIHLRLGLRGREEVNVLGKMGKVEKGCDSDGQRVSFGSSFAGATGREG